MDWLDNCKLFDKFNGDQLTAIDKDYIAKRRYQKGALIAQDGDICRAVGIVISGRIALQTLYPSGKVLTHLQLTKSGVFGEALLFNQSNRYPLNVIAGDDCQIGFIAKQNLLTIFNDYPQALQNYLMLMSNKLLLLNQKIFNLSLDTLDKRIANFLLQAARKQNKAIFKIGLSRKAMAEVMGVQRPSLSRTLSKMRRAGIIDFDGDLFKILDSEKLTNILVD